MVFGVAIRKRISAGPNALHAFHALLLAVALGLAHGAMAQLPAQPSPQTYQPITGKQRINWFVKSTVGPLSLLAGVGSAGLSTATNTPPEYGPGWEGFGKRYGMRLTGVSTGNAMEVGFGAIWKEDPRYFRVEHQPFKKRVKNVFTSTFTAPIGRDGHIGPAYARHIGNVGNNFLSNTWRARSASDASSALSRIGWGVLERMGGNAFQEFWPDVKRKLFKK